MWCIRLPVVRPSKSEVPLLLSVKTAPGGKLADDQVKSSPSTSVALMLKVISTPSVPSWS